MRLPLPLFLACLCLSACGEADPKPTPDAQAEVADATPAKDTQDTTDTAATVQKWAALPLVGGTKLNAIAPVPGKSGSYVVVGESAGAWQLDGATFTSIAPTDIGTANLRGVWVAADGTVFAAGQGSALLRRDEQGWNLAGEVPAAPPVQFNAVAGSAANDVWAVGEDTQAWRFDGTVWAPVAVSPTTLEVGAELVPEADFTCLHVVTKGEVWIGAKTNKGGLVLHGNQGKWHAFSLAEAPLGIWVSAPVASLGNAPRVFVVGATSGAKNFVALREGTGSFVVQDKVLWQLGFTGVAGVGEGPAWATARKGQLRKWQAGVFSVEEIKSPPFTKPSEAIQLGNTDLLGLAIHDADERAVLSANTVYRWGKQ